MKTVFVTGSTEGIGKAIIQEFNKTGYFTISNGRKDVKTIAKQHVKADLSIYQAIAVIDYHIKQSLDSIVFNVGTKSNEKFGNLVFADWKNTFDTNINIPLFLLQKLRPKLSNNASIIFISSLLGKHQHSTSLDYGVSKATVNALVKNLVKEFVGTNITVNAIAPGFIDTKWHKNKTIITINRIREKIALKRFGTPTEVAKLVVSVVENKYINGQIIGIDGGYDYC